MDNKIYLPGDPFAFDRLHLTNPRHGSGADVYVSDYQLRAPASRVGSSVYFQAPRCTIERELVFTGRKQSIDLVFRAEDELSAWMAELVAWTVQYMYGKRDVWFMESDSMTPEYIEEHFTYPLKPVRGHRIKMRATLNKTEMVVYDEAGEPQTDAAKLEENHDIVPILRLRGVRCVGVHFMLDMEIMQLMVLAPMFTKCLIVGRKPAQPVVTQNEHEPEPEPEAEPEPEPEPEAEPEPEPEPEAEHEPEPEPEAEHEPEPEPAGRARSELPTVETVYSDDESDEDGESEGGGRDAQYEQLLSSVLSEGMEDFELREEEPGAPDPRDVYREMRQRAKRARDEAMSLHLESKKVKNQFAIEDISDEDEEF